MSEIKSAVLSLAEVFRAPLEAKGVNLSSIVDKIEDIVEYSRAYLRLGCNTYKKIWYQLQTSPDSVKWPNVICLSELLFSLPFSTAKVERWFFSILKVIKNEERTRLSCSTLNDLLEIKTEGPPFCGFSSDAAVDLWWKDSSGRRVQQKPRKEYRKRKPSAATATASASEDEASETELESDLGWFSECVVQDATCPLDSSD